MQYPNQLKNQINVFWKSIFVFVFSLLHTQAFTQCINSSTLGGGTFADDNAIAGAAFSDPENGSADDGSLAVASATLTLFGSRKTHYLKATNFGFAIPASATICGISVWIKKRATGIIPLLYSVTDEQVRLVIGGTITGNNKADADTWTETSAFTTYGGTSDKWGTTITPAQVNSSNFGVAIAASYNAIAGVFLSAEIDYIMMQVSYMDIPVPLILGQFTTNISGNIVSNKWTMYEEEANGKINLQRSANAKNWETIKTINAHYFVGERTYQFIDKLEKAGFYYYRLELVHAAGKTTHSKINLVNYKPDIKSVDYPNPTTSNMYISDISNKDGFVLYTTLGEKITAPYIYLNGILQLNLKALRPGNYFLITPEKRLTITKQ